MSPKPNRRWYQFSLKTLLIVMTVATLAFGGWVQYRRERARVNRDRVAAVRDAVVAIEELGGDVTSAYEELRPQTWLEEQFDDPGTGDDPIGILKVTRVDLYDTEATDADLKYVERLTTLGFLRLGCWEAIYSNTSKITDAGMEHLTGLSNLEELDLLDTKVTDAGLEHLNGLTKLKSLRLNDTNVTIEGVKKLKRALPNCVITRVLYDIS